MSESLFPSGPWTGFYNYRPGNRHRMDLHLTFAKGTIDGEGNDDIGRFIIRGRYQEESRECHWTKSYLGAHDVFYQGFREGKGIWGTWQIGVLGHGGFHIWPRQAGEGETTTEEEAVPEPVEAVGIEVWSSAGRGLQAASLSQMPGAQDLSTTPAPARLHRVAMHRK